jgi:hypothetical protein
MWQGSFPRVGLCCPRPSSGTTTPSATLPARCDFPSDRLYAPAAPGPQRPGPGRASPVPVPTLCPSRSPYPGGFLGACTSRSSAPSMAFAVLSAARHPLVPLTGASLTRLQDSRHATGWAVAPPEGAFDAALRRQAFPPDAGSLLLGLLAATQAGLPPAGAHGLTRGSPSAPTSSRYAMPHAAGHTKPGLAPTRTATNATRRWHHPRARHPPTAGLHARARMTA